jgi:hypothetical protein
MAVTSPSCSLRPMTWVTALKGLLGHVPLIGKLLSPEKGGGLFAAIYSLRGSLSDPSVSVNPLSALTPGFLRGLFGKL